LFRKKLLEQEWGYNLFGVSFLLGEVLRELGEKRWEDVFPLKSVGWYKEKELWNRLEPFPGKFRWKIKDYRPFLVVHCDNEYVYLILFTSFKGRLRCKRDREYGIEYETPKVDLAHCDLDTGYPCSNLSGSSMVFKRRIGSDCRFVLRIKKDLLRRGSQICGTCGDKALPEVLKRIIEKELNEWTSNS
jgi:hypothetical protein